MLAQVVELPFEGRVCERPGEDFGRIDRRKEIIREEPSG
jgi:hypothetical protein